MTPPPSPMPDELREKIKQLAEELAKRHGYLRDSSAWKETISDVSEGARAMYAALGEENARLLKGEHWTQKELDQSKETAKWMKSYFDTVERLALSEAEVGRLKGQVDRLSALFIDGKALAAPAGEEEGNG